MRLWILVAMAGWLAGCPQSVKEVAVDQALQALDDDEALDDGAAPAPAAAPGTVGARMNGATRTAPSDPSHPLNVSKPDEARVRVDLAGVRAAIREYRMLHDGRNPKSVAELDLNLSFPGDIVYDARTGRARSRSYPQY